MNFLKKLFKSLKYFRGFQLPVFNLRSNKGVTIVELLVVVAIIGIVSGIVVTSVSNSKAKSRDAKRIADISVIQLALENYYDRNGKYPTSLSVFSSDSSVPTKDSFNSDYKYVALDCSVVNVPYSYHLGAVLELDNSILSDDDLDKDFNSTSASSCGGSVFNGAESKTYDVLPSF